MAKSAGQSIQAGLGNTSAADAGHIRCCKDLGNDHARQQRPILSQRRKSRPKKSNLNNYVWLSPEAAAAFIM